MARITRAAVFDPSEIAVVHMIARTVRRCYLFGDDPMTGNNYGLDRGRTSLTGSQHGN
jgi:hypothetical protein